LANLGTGVQTVRAEYTEENGKKHFVGPIEIPAMKTIVLQFEA